MNNKQIISYKIPKKTNNLNRILYSLKTNTNILSITEPHKIIFTLFSIIIFLSSQNPIIYNNFNISKIMDNTITKTKVT